MRADEEEEKEGREAGGIWEAREEHHLDQYWTDNQNEKEGIQERRRV